MNRTARRSMASFRKFISTGVSELRGLRPTSDPADVPVVKKKLCRLSNGHQDGQNFRRFSRTGGESTDANERNRSERLDGDRFLEISVVRSDQKIAAVVAKVKPDNMNAKTSEVLPLSRADHDGGGADDSSGVVWKNAVISDEDRQTSGHGHRRGKCVAFCDEIVVHSFEDDFDDNNSDLNSSENASEQDDDLSSTQNDIEPIDVRHWNTVDATTPAAAVPPPRKIPLRRLVFGRINGNNRAGVFRNSLPTRESVVRRPGLAPKTTVTRTKSLVDSSVRHSFVKVDDDKDDGQNGGPGGVQLVLPLGPFCAPRDVSVTASGDGRKIKVLLLKEATAAKRATDDGSLTYVGDRRRDYSECFYLPKAVNPLRTKATVDSEGILRISAPFASDFPVRTL